MPVLFFYKPFSDTVRVYHRLGTEHPKCKLFFCHFKTEYGNRLSQLKANMLGNIKGKCCLSHRGSPTNNYKDTFLKACSQVIKVSEARRDTCYCLFFVIETFDHLETIFDNLF